MEAEAQTRAWAGTIKQITLKIRTSAAAPAPASPGSFLALEEKALNLSHVYSDALARFLYAEDVI